VARPLVRRVQREEPTARYDNSRKKTDLLGTIGTHPREKGRNKERKIETPLLISVSLGANSGIRSKWLGLPHSCRRRALGSPARDRPNKPRLNESLAGPGHQLGAAVAPKSIASHFAFGLWGRLPQLLTGTNARLLGSHVNLPYRAASKRLGAMVNE
jgi:hypothetical protein